MSPQPLIISHLAGTALPLRGDDIDTDRIMPARFLRAVSFDGLERHVFEDDRAADPRHPFNDARFSGASILVVNANFGCGSSREHAPQGLYRAGIRAIVGESFSEIFRGNSAVIGLPCIAVNHAGAARLQEAIERDPRLAVSVDIARSAVSAGDITLDAALPGPLRDAFLAGQWNPTALLLDRFDDVRAVAERLPYIAGF